MRNSITILNVATMLFLVGCIIFTIANYRQLSEGEGWGVVFMIGIFLFGSTAFVVDVVIKNFIKNRFIRNLAGVVAIAVYFLLFYFGT